MVETVSRWGSNTLLVVLALTFYTLCITLK